MQRCARRLRRIGRGCDRFAHGESIVKGQQQRPEARSGAQDLWSLQALVRVDMRGPAGGPDRPLRPT